MKKANRVFEIIFYVLAVLFLIEAVYLLASGIEYIQSYLEQQALYADLMTATIGPADIFSYLVSNCGPFLFYAVACFALGWIFGGRLSSNDEPTLEIGILDNGKDENIDILEDVDKQPEDEVVDLEGANTVPVDDDTESFRDRLDDAADDLKDHADDAADKIKDGFVSLKDKVEDKFDDVRDDLKKD